MLIDKEKAYPNETDQETIRRKLTLLEKSMEHWFELRIKFMGVASKFSLPSSTGVHDVPTENKPEQLMKMKKKKKKASSQANVESWPLSLPSSLVLDDDKVQLKPLMEYETKLQKGAAFDSLHAVLLAADQLWALGYNKSKNIRGYKPNTKAQEKLHQVKYQWNLGIADWNAHRNALLAMGTMDTTQMKGLPDLKKEDTARKSVDMHCQPVALKIVDGAAYTWFCHASIQNAG